ncbi:cardiolipin synthase [uncultured Shimia sp.]|uniref:cardiolipin synthase n=1 Tax=uncultured Shimia sp. TaxID=573152 RepID=UPI0026295174|nr:cardiolipin synthase [uncultured Shimia sp.]
MLASYSLILLILLEGVAIYFAYRAVTGARTPQGSVAWVLFLILAPYAGIIAYIFLGHHRMNGYVIARRKSERVLEGIKSARKAHPSKGDAAALGYAGFEAQAAAPVLSGNAFELLIDGDETFEAMFEAIRSAKSYVLIQFYIVRDDTLGRLMQAELMAVAERGVKVRFLYDSIGSARLSNSYIQTLQDAGVEMLDTNALKGPTNRRQVNFRNHRKTLIVDGHVGFIGGHNLGDEYLGNDPNMGHWRDTHCMLRGPMVNQLQLVFTEDWYWATQDSLLDALDWTMQRQPEDMDGLILPSGPADELETGSLYYCSAIRAAKERIWISTPYFVPDGDIATALKVAALSGVDVRILIPNKADHWATYLASYGYFDMMRATGVQFWRYENGFMHQKVLLVDETIASVGTFNMDARSCRLNFEATAMVFDPRAAQDVAAMFKADFAQSYEFTENLAEQPLWVRLGAPVARLFAPLL